MKSEKIFGIGLSKTGTTSLFAALDMLGYQSGTYRHLKKKGLGAWFKGDFSVDYISHFEALTDLPIGAFFPALDAYYPGSKFILTTRNKKEWLESCRKFFSVERRDRPASFYHQTQLATYGIATYDKAQFSFIYDRHENSVRDYFKDRPNDLLEMSIIEGEGWGPLCAFLDKPIPDLKFPNIVPGGYKLPEEQKRSSLLEKSLERITSRLRKSLR